MFDKTQKKYVTLSPQQNMQMAGATLPPIDSTGVFYYTPSTHSLALLSAVDLTNGLPIYAKLAGETTIPPFKITAQGPFPEPDNTIVADGKQLDAARLGVTGASTPCPYVYTLAIANTMFQLENNGMFLKYDDYRSQFTMVKNAYDAQIFELVNGQIILHESYLVHGDDWKQWNVSRLQLSDDFKTAVVKNITISTMASTTPYAQYTEGQTKLCAGAICYTLQIPNKKYQLPVQQSSLLGMRINNLVIKPLSTYRPMNTFAVQFPANVASLKSTSVSSHKDLAWIFPLVIVGVGLFIWLLCLLIRSTLITKAQSGKPLTPSDTKALTALLEHET